MFTLHPNNPLFILSDLDDGTMQLRALEVSQQNRNNFFAKQMIDPSRVVSAQLANSGNIQIVNIDHAGKIIPQTDGLITSCRDIYLSITVADCLPVVIYSPGKVVAILHCGWRGLDQSIISSALGMIEREYEIYPSSLSAIIGPGIESHHYPVSPEIADKFLNYKDVITEENNDYYLDIKTVAFAQLQQLGVPSERIETSDICTFCNPKYFSARRDKHTPVHAMIAMTRL